MENTHLFWLKALTNLHVGSGELNYGVIDNLVQREVLTKFPTINESGLKGALKEYCTHQIKVKNGISDTKIAQKEKEIKLNFGNSDDSGGLRFYGANLLSFPVRTNKVMFLNATCPQILADLQERLSTFGFDKLAKEVSEFNNALVNKLEDNSPLVFVNSNRNYQIEYKNFKAIPLERIPIPSIFSNELVVLTDLDALKIIGPNKLPVLARNSLRDGQSENLWYEEIVPRQSKFYFFIQDNSIGDTEYQWFEDQINGQSVQVGANASIGQGLCKINKHELETITNKEENENNN